MSTTADDQTAAAALDTGGIAGHPRGLTTLFFTEMWERFSFYGMKAILSLYMTAPLMMGGMELSDAHAGLILGNYTSSVYLTPLVGGWLADRYLGTRLAVLIGGIVIACGHFSLAVPSMATFYLGLILITLGTGLLKPNMSAMVGQLYAAGDARRDAGFSIYYMGINLGAFIAPLVCGFLAQHPLFKHFIVSMGFKPENSWHWGFAAAGVGMVLGLTQYVLGGNRLRGIGLRPARRSSGPASESSGAADVVAIFLTMLGAAAGFLVSYRVNHAISFETALFPTVVGGALGYLAAVLRGLRGDELKRVLVIFILCAFSVIFWMSFEQSAGSLTLFADRFTRNSIFGHEYPSSWYQAVQPLFVILLAPVFAALWVKLGRRQPSSPTKFAFGLLFAGMAFGLMALASTLTGAGRVSPLWLVFCYLLQTFGELCLSPVGLSTVTRLSPARLVGLMMGTWFLFTSFGEFIAGWSMRYLNENDQARLFGTVAGITFVAAAILFALVPLIRKLIPQGAEG
ncbi:MAG TPA: peptide MFS transporter [Tepidisphaeraceae bacterium]|jgi:POT family proton-dependent oligopeptide transporter|nr:peptide MFS transporter [Tepidisphaeraceae bacterium]